MDEFDIEKDLSRFRLKPSEIMTEEIAAGRRWSLLQAVAWIASHDAALVAEVGEWTPTNVALSHPRGAQTAALALGRRLQERGSRISFEAAQMSLLTALHKGEVMAYVDNQETLLTGITFRGFTYKTDMIGLEPAPDARYWGSVHVNAETVKGLSALSSPVTASASIPVTTPKIGRPLKWKWDDMIADLVRVADEDGLDAIGPQQADVERWAAAWFEQRNGGKSPSEGDIRAKVSKVFQAKAMNNQRKAEK